MSEELTKERLDQMEDLLHTSTTSNEFYTKRLEARERVTCLAMIHLSSLLSMARRTLQAEERLQKAVAALVRIENDNMECGHCSRGGMTPDELATEVLMEIAVDSPKDLHPPAQCAPPEGTDVPPDKDQVCAHGVPIGYVCPECDAEAMRKGLDDHSCNSTGWEKP